MEITDRGMLTFENRSSKVITGARLFGEKPAEISDIAEQDDDYAAVPASRHENAGSNKRVREEGDGPYGNEEHAAGAETP